MLTMIMMMTMMRMVMIMLTNDDDIDVKDEIAVGWNFLKLNFFLKKSGILLH